MVNLDNKNTSKNIHIFVCEKCDFKCSKMGDWNRHIATQKHKKITNDNKNYIDYIQEYTCTCGNTYKYQSGLSRHKKTCFSKDDINEETKQQQLVEYLLKENSEFKQLMIEQHNQMLEQNKQMIELAKNSAGHHNNTNSHNNSFNLNFFLNETCKNAMNIMDFVNQLQIGIKELEETGRLGFADGISKIFINGLKQLDVSQRPVHCSDPKRETMYIKSNNEWNKEDQDKALLTNAIKHVAHKNIKQIPEWTKENPQYKDGESKENDKYLKIVSESMSGSSEEETNKNYTKIIKSIAKETIIDR